MKLLLSTALLALPALCACAATKSESPAPPSPEAMMEAMMRAGMPGEHHRALDAFVGTWESQITMWMDPAAPPSASTGRMVNEWILDGRYLEQRFTGEFGGQAFSGRGTMGYDVAAGQYNGIWMDSMSTSISTTTAGTLSPDGKTFTLAVENTDPVTGTRSRGEEVITVDGPDRHTFHMYDLSTGSRVKSMEIVYTRAR